MTQITLDTSKGQLVPLYFGQDAVAASQTNVQIPCYSAEEGGVTAGYEMPFDGEIVAVSFTLSAAGSAGSLTIGGTVNGTEAAASTIEAGTDAANYQRVTRGGGSFVASDSIGCEITSDGSWNGTTADLGAIVWVLLYMEGI